MMSWYRVVNWYRCIPDLGKNQMCCSNSQPHPQRSQKGQIAKNSYVCLASSWHLRSFCDFTMSGRISPTLLMSIHWPAPHSGPGRGSFQCAIFVQRVDPLSRLTSRALQTLWTYLKRLKGINDLLGSIVIDFGICGVNFEGLTFLSLQGGNLEFLRGIVIT
jgi:hypothetical protein